MLSGENNHLRIELMQFPAIAGDQGPMILGQGFEDRLQYGELTRIAHMQGNALSSRRPRQPLPTTRFGFQAHHSGAGKYVLCVDPQGRLEGRHCLIHAAQAFAHQTQMDQRVGSAWRQLNTAFQSRQRLVRITGATIARTQQIMRFRIFRRQNGRLFQGGNAFSLMPRYQQSLAEAALCRLIAGFSVQGAAKIGNGRIKFTLTGEKISKFRIGGSIAGIDPERFVEIIIGAAPLLGLLGTVTGLVTVFGNISPETGLPDQASFTQGIALALTTTVLGMAVAIPCLVGNGYLQRKVETYAVQLDSLLERLDAQNRTK